MMEGLTLDKDFNDEITLDTLSKNYLRETAKWAKFLAILGFITIGLFVVIGLFAGSVMASVMSSGAGADLPIGMSGGLLTMIYLASGLLMVMPCLYMYKFATKMQKALEHNNQAECTEAFMNLKSLYKFYGILMIIMIALYLLFFVIAIFFGLSGAM